MKNLLFAALTLCTIVLFSCGGSCDLEEFATETTAVTQLAYFSGDTTAAACEAYSSAITTIIDDYGDCEDASIKTVVDGYRTSLEGLECN